jgi:hypothetical protein
MIPKEKAKELVDKMMYHLMYNCQPTLSEMVAKQCALIAVYEIRSCINWNHYPLDREWRFWDEVEQEIEKL